MKAIYSDMIFYIPKYLYQNDGLVFSIAKFSSAVEFLSLFAKLTAGRGFWVSQQKKSAENPGG